MRIRKKHLLEILRVLGTWEKVRIKFKENGVKKWRNASIVDACNEHIEAAGKRIAMKDIIKIERIEK